MNNSAIAIEEPLAAAMPDAANGNPANVSGIVLPPFDQQAALATLEWLRQQDPEQQRETFEYLKRALSETRAANGEKLLLPDEEKQESPQPIYLPAAGFVFQPIDVEAALRALQSLDDFDVEEQRETFACLRQGLNEDRAAGGERLLFP